MPAWNELLNQFAANATDADKAAWIQREQGNALRAIAARRGDRNVLLYASAFLQKPQVPSPSLLITFEEMNGFMSVIYGMDWAKGLTLLLHTPGGVTNATESLVAYLWSKFSDIEVIIPTFAMSAGTMISLASDRVLMGRQSQLGPIDPQMQVGGNSVSARAIVDQFDRAKQEVLGNQQVAHVWAPILGSLGPALLQEAQNALGYSERMVAGWLAARMYKNMADPVTAGKQTAAHFNDASKHMSHGRRIDRDEARNHGVIVEDLEADQQLQDSVLTAYHIATLTFEHGPSTKLLVSHTNRVWAKNFVAK